MRRHFIGASWIEGAHAFETRNPSDSREIVDAYAGKVLELSVVPGEFRNDTSAPVMTIADLSTVWVSSQVPETYIRLRALWASSTRITAPVTTSEAGETR